MLDRYFLNTHPLNVTTLTETIINLETVNPIEFFGVNNQKFDILKKKFPLLKILSRGTQIKLSGAPEQIEQAKEKIGLIIQYMERNGHLSEQYFEQILGGDDAETIKARTTDLMQASMKLGEAMYAAQQNEAGAAEDAKTPTPTKPRPKCTCRGRALAHGQGGPESCPGAIYAGAAREG